MSGGADGGFGIYIHWPFCQSKCPYCDFNSHVREGVDQERWRRALLAELDHYAAETKGRAVTSVFFGGGTPSLMPPRTVAGLIERISRHWSVGPEVEITLEANPGSVEAAKFADLAKAGVNRLSLGVQALGDDALRFLGRRHDEREALAAIGLASRHFPRWSFDLIYARPGQSAADWERELDRALGLAGEHLSLYQLTIEANTAFEGAARRGELTLPDEATGEALFDLTQAKLLAAGLPAYEISNHARPGAECRHNLVYWQGGDYVGIGPGAHGRLTTDRGRFATRQHRAPEVWLAGVEAEGHATREHRMLGAGERLEELLLMGLRLSAGLSRERVRAALGQEIEQALDGARLQRLIEGGFLVVDAKGIRTTPEGRLRLNAVLSALLA